MRLDGSSSTKLYPIRSFTAGLPGLPPIVKELKKQVYPVPRGKVLTRTEHVLMNLVDWASAHIRTLGPVGSLSVF